MSLNLMVKSLVIHSMIDAIMPISPIRVLPFSCGCSSQASVAVGKSPPRKPKSESSQNVTSKTSSRRSSSKGRTKNSFGWLPLAKLNISGGIQRFIRTTIKGFSQLFVYKEEIEEVTVEMEIGFPTDVKHVTHIGLDGTTTTNPVKGWEDFIPPDHIMAFPSISLGQLELVMAAQTQNGHLLFD
ncbi:CRIB domain-containing protein RIC4-like [Durio zibethinus]|uniref:CRIB domain-containing protein RIC4-like n=1 Tax=Durio zibethinus TaxID=66656 RepID=A0A6P6A7E2_DURZI|nr:CRIB domain-containing protein RIC4-like [Durio zibethinus]